MIELPEAMTLASQIQASLVGKKIVRAVANESPHRFAWYTGDPESYGRRLDGATIGSATASGNYVETRIGDQTLVTSTSLRLHAAGTKLPTNRQLLLVLSDGTSLTAHVQMWGAILCLGPGQVSGQRDHEASKQMPSPLDAGFSLVHFRGLLPRETDRLSAKAFLATEQRIPGLGNGVLQDILWTARLHPKRWTATLSPPEVKNLHRVVRAVLLEMTRLGGRDTERDLFGEPGGYRTILCAKTATAPCPACGGAIKKEAYLGGSIYYCPVCQPIG